MTTATATKPRAASADTEARTCEVVASVGAEVSRAGVNPSGTYSRWVEKLDLTGVRLGRAAGAPVLTDHVALTANVVGSIERMALQGGKLVARLRFSKSERGEAVFREVADGILTSVSIGYRVLVWAESGKRDGLPVFTARDWEILEISLVAVGADAAAKVRSLDNEGATNGTMIYREAPMTTLMTRSAEGGAPAPVLDDTQARGQGVHDADEISNRVELARMDTVSAIAGKLRVPENDSVFLRCMDGMSVTEARTALINRAAEISQASLPRSGGAMPGHYGNSDPVDVAAGWLAHRLAPDAVALPPEAARYRGQTLLSVDRMVGAPNRRDIGGLHTSSDFVSLVNSGANRALLAQFERALSPLVRLARRTEVADFRAIQRVRLGEFPTLQPVGEHGEYKRVSLTDNIETYFVKTYGYVFGLTRTLIVNDDLNLFGDVLNQMALAAAAQVGDVLYGALNGPAGHGIVMSDGIAAFNAAHNNLAAVGSALDLDSVSAARKSMRQVRGLGGSRINVTPKYLLVGPELETRAEQIATQIAAATVETTNVFGGRLEVLTESRIEDSKFYIFADPAVLPALEWAELNGTRPMSGRGPFTETRVGFNMDGVEFKVGYDVGATIVSSQGAYLNPGV